MDLDRALDAIALSVDRAIAGAHLPDGPHAPQDDRRIERIAESIAGFALGAIAADLARRAGSRDELAGLAASVRIPRPRLGVDELVDTTLAGRPVAPADAVRARTRAWLRAARPELRRVMLALADARSLAETSRDDLVAARVGHHLEVAWRGDAELGARRPAPPPHVTNYCWMRIR